MNRKYYLIAIVFILAALLASSVSGVVAQGPTVNVGAAAGNQPATSAFTYQGQLKNSGTAVSGSCDFQFSLWGRAVGLLGQYVPIGSTLDRPNVSVSNGLFSVLLDFGSGSGIFSGEARYLGITVRCPTGSGSYTDLGKQTLTAAPYALSLVPGAVISGTAYQNLKVMSNAPTGGVPAAVSGELYTATDGIGVFGINYTAGLTGTGVYGQQGAGSLATLHGGVVGSSILPNSSGVVGEANNGSYGAGVFGTSASGTGVYGTSSTGTGVYGISFGGSSSYAGYFNGNVYVTGNLSAEGTKPFKIDNPLNPARQYLYHYAVESPQVQNMYNGTIILDAKGEAVVTLPDYFSAVNSGEFQYQLTAIGAPMPNLYIAEEITDNHFKIAGGVAGKKVSWIVFGQRSDPWLRDHPQTDVVDKPAKEAGTYLYPQGYGQPLSMGTDYTRTHALEPTAQPTAPIDQP